MLGGALQHHARRGALATDPEPFLKTWDVFAQQVTGSGDMPETMKHVRAFLAGEAVPQLTDTNIALMISRVTKELAVVSSPSWHTKDVKWRGDVYDAMNKLLYQRLCRVRGELGLPDAPGGAREEREQKKQLLAHPDGKRVLAAVMATNNGYVESLSHSLLNYRRFEGNREMLNAEIWMGTEGVKDDQALIRGAMGAFLAWNPMHTRFSTFMEKAVGWQVKAIARRELRFEEGEFRKHKHPVQMDVRLNEMSIEAHDDDIRRERGKMEDAARKMGKVREALSLMEPRGQKIMAMMFKGIMEGTVPTLEEMAPELSTKDKPITRERVRQLRVQAYQEFMDSWSVVAGRDDAMPAALERFLSRIRDNDEGPAAGRA